MAQDKRMRQKVSPRRSIFHRAILLSREPQAYRIWPSKSERRFPKAEGRRAQHTGGTITAEYAQHSSRSLFTDKAQFTPVFSTMKRDLNAGDELFNAALFSGAHWAEAVPANADTPHPRGQS